MKITVKIFGDQNIKEKEQYASIVYKLLENNYKSIGGINIGSGFTDLEDMKKNIPVWRLTFKNRKLISVMLFKVKQDKLKMVAYGPFEGISPEVKRSDLQFMLKNSFAELSGKLLTITLKEIGADLMEFVSKYPKQLLKKKIIPLSEYLEKKILPANSEGMFRKLQDKYPELLKYCYLRKIGNEFKLKLLIEAK